MVYRYYLLIIFMMMTKILIEEKIVESERNISLDVFMHLELNNTQFFFQLWFQCYRQSLIINRW